jgi:outer membrane receptor protein involved in Fe transport
MPRRRPPSQPQSTARHAASGAAACVLGLTVAASIPAHADPAPASAPLGTEQVVVTAHKRPAVEKKNDLLDTARDKNLLPKIGATSYSIGQKDIAALPLGENTPIDKVLLQAPGVSADTAISNPDFHIRNEYANVQYRINGVQLPDGVSALAPVLETGLIGSLNLLDGTLPAQYGLRTAGVVDISTKPNFTQGGDIDINLGSQATINPGIDYAGIAGPTEYFLTARYLQSNEGLESATPTQSPVHDRTAQEKFFGYGSTLLNDTSRLTYMAGGFVGHFQIPDVTGQAPLGDFGPPNLSSSRINETENDSFFFGLVALQTHDDTIDTQTSLFARDANTHFIPDIFNDLAFDDVASSVTRKSLLGGVQFDAADRVSDTHTLRAGLEFSGEQTHTDDLSTVLPLSPDGTPLPTPVTLNDAAAKFGWSFGSYIQDEWKLRPDLTLNTGVRFDQISQFVSANQVSPRVVLVYKPFVGTSLHAGVSRYFTPPMQAQATPNNLALFRNTVQQPAISREDPVRPERATYFDVGLDQQLPAGFDFGLDLYYKRSTDTLDDGQFGQAVVLDQFNYAHGYSRGAEFKLNYNQNGFRAYANLSAEITKGREIVSNQYLIGDPLELAYLADHYTYASDAQTISASWGASYRWQGILASVDGLYGSGLRAGFANQQHTPGYTQWNAAISRSFGPWHTHKPLTLRLSFINMFDSIYLLRSGSGIGEFAPQYGPRREIFLGISQAF